jgi:hypothetical protein
LPFFGECILNRVVEPDSAVSADVWIPFAEYAVAHRFKCELQCDFVVTTSTFRARYLAYSIKAREMKPHFMGNSAGRVGTGGDDTAVRG